MRGRGLNNLSMIGRQKANVELVPRLPQLQSLPSSLGSVMVIRNQTLEFLGTLNEMKCKKLSA